ncbi:hypothetical protein [Blautia sp. MSJ-19]|uniref:hypothetical protein n=1 Tax=Blautia sp. MSJ-19 TaxID=2841517 RepID=UPI001C0EA3F3|nr:hypothetical protein [Blautia sp. MSJ-19]MBU5482437.1 hypothetical protein [Blautia sp. MSJ-19]
MKKLLAICIGSLFLTTLSGCAPGDVIDRFSTSDTAEIQDIHPESTRVYMDEIRGTLQDFNGNQLTILSDSSNYIFDVSQATLECQDGMITGDAISVIYEGQLNSTDTGAVRALKVADDYHETTELEEKTTRGQVQSLTANSITVKSKGGKTVTFPVTGTEQYYQSGLKAGVWVYLHYKGEFGSAHADDPNLLDGSHMKIFSVSDIDPLKVPDPTPTPDSAKNKDQEKQKENTLRAVIRNIQTNVLQVSAENSSDTLNLDISKIPCYFSGGIESGSHVNITYTGDFDGSSLEGITILGITGEIPENLSDRSTGFTISGDIAASTANTITLLTYDGMYVTCNTENASNVSTGGLLSGSSVKITFNPADSRQSNIYQALKIEDL